MIRPSSTRSLRVLLPVAVSVLTLGAGAGLTATTSEERYTLSGPSLAIYDLAGEISIEAAAAGTDVEIVVVRGGADASRLRVERGPVGGVSTLRVIFPDSRVVYPRSGPGSWSDRLRVGDDGRFGDSHGTSDRLGRHDVQISGRGPGLEAHADLRIRVPAGRRLALYLGAGSATVANIDGDLSVNVSSAPVTTQHTRGTLNIDSGSGELKVRDALGDVTLDTGSGGATVRGVRGEHLKLDTGSGGVTVLDAEVSTLFADTGSGSVEIADVRTPEMNLDSGSGSVRVRMLSGPLRSLAIDSGSGGVTLVVPDDLNASFDIESGSGGVRIQAPHTIESRDDDRVRGRFGDGRGQIRIESGSGGVRILPRSASESRFEGGGLGTFLRFSFA